MSITARRPLWLGLATLLCATMPAAAQINTGTPPTVPNWPIFTTGRVAGAANFVSLGQSFTVAPGMPTSLTGFQFWVRDDPGFGGGSFHAYVFPWDPGTRRITGDYLFRSALQPGLDASVPTAWSFSTGGVELASGQTFLAVPKASDIPRIVECQNAAYPHLARESLADERKFRMQLAAFPDSGRMVPELQRPDLREVLEGPSRDLSPDRTAGGSPRGRSCTSGGPKRRVAQAGRRAT